MALRGSGAMVAMYDVEPGWEAGHDHWHAQEHMAERLGIPGFRRGRRAIASDGRPRCFVMYEVDALSTQVSPAYLARLNDPTPWTRRVMPHMTGMTRTLARVVASVGDAVGGWLATVRLNPPAAAKPGLVRWLAGGALAEAAGAEGLLGAHLLAGDAEASRTPTEEKTLRAAPDEVADWIVMLEGYEGERVALAVRRVAALLAERGAGAGELATYQLAQVLDAPRKK